MGHIVSRNGASHAASWHGAGWQTIRFPFLMLIKALVLCALVGCAAPQQVTVGEAYKIPQPHHALLQTHEKPKCDFGAPSELPVKAKAEVADSWTPYSGKPENGTEKAADPQPEKETPTGLQKVVDAEPANEPETGPEKEAHTQPEKEPEIQSAKTKEAATQPAPETAEPAEHYALLSKERNCYQNAEVTVRNKLHKLQSSVGKTVIALQKETTVRVNTQEQGSTP